MRRAFRWGGLAFVVLGILIAASLIIPSSAGGHYLALSQGSQNAETIVAYFNLPGNAEDDDIKGQIAGLLRNEVAKSDSLDIAIFSFSQPNLAEGDLGPHRCRGEGADDHGCG